MPDPLADLLLRRRAPGSFGAPVAQPLVWMGVIASVLMLLAGAIGASVGHHHHVAWLSWVFVHRAANWGIAETHQLAAPLFVLATVLLAVNLILLTGIRVGKWARALIVLQVLLLPLCCLPLIVALSLTLLTIMF